jgi:LAO/AO transport system kinase
VSDLAQEIASGDRRALSQGITIVESTRSDDRGRALALLTALLPRAGGAIRVGVSGAPGAGKSTLIEALGVMLADAGTRVGVLAVDPSSARSGGSILGDRTRMEELSRHDSAFIRPSPSGGTLGGVARRTREAMILIEAWGAEVILVETVGVGQSEITVAGMVDQFLLLITPGGGDELQGIKRGVMELADVIAVNKADGELAGPAERSRAEYASAMRLMRPRHTGLPTPVLTCSALERTGLEVLWSTLLERHAVLESDGRLAELRARQAQEWLWSEIREGLVEAIAADPETARLANRREAQIRAGDAFPPAAAREIVDALIRKDER